MKIKILIIEDEAVIAMDLAERLENNGYEIVGIVDNGTEALEIASSQMPDIALVDISIKGVLDGIQTAAQLNTLSNIPIIYATALSDRHTIERAQLTYPYAYLVKPFRDIDLFNSIEIAFRNASIQKLTDGECASESLFYLNDRVFIRTTNATFEKVLYTDILYLEAERSYCTVITQYRSYTVSNSLNHVLHQINAPQIVRIHKSYAVNTTHIQKLHEQCIWISDKEIPIGAGYRSQIMEILRLVK
jgi:DNA-binding LytR/AlgR family response regulator